VSTPIEVEIHSTDTAIISLHGEHDLETSQLLEAALAATSCRPCVIVDLSPCTFADTTVVNVIMRAVRMHCDAGGQLLLVAPAAHTPARRALELMGIDQIHVMHGSSSAALARARAGPPHHGVMTLSNDMDRVDLRRSA
jgi:anti-anti-sigma regulatory factor